MANRLQSLAFVRRTNPTRREDLLWVLGTLAFLALALSSAVDQVQRGPVLWRLGSVLVTVLFIVNVVRIWTTRYRHGYWQLFTR